MPIPATEWDSVLSFVHKLNGTWTTRLANGDENYLLSNAATISFRIRTLKPIVSMNSKASHKSHNALYFRLWTESQKKSVLCSSTFSTISLVCRPHFELLFSVFGPTKFFTYRRTSITPVVTISRGSSLEGNDPPSSVSPPTGNKSAWSVLFHTWLFSLAMECS